MATSLVKLYKKIQLVSRSDTGINFYTCLERLKDGRFAVHQMDFIPRDRVHELNQFQVGIDSDFLYLFCDDDVDIRCDWFNSLIEAIDAHNILFEN